MADEKEELEPKDGEGTEGEGLDYQSECHCSKTQRWSLIHREELDYQSECHCSKTHRQR